MPPAGRRVIRYEYLLPGGGEVDLSIELDEATVTDVRPIPAEVPDWARLGFHQCPSCPLNVKKVKACPVAARLAGVVETFGELFSYQRVAVRVVTPERVFERTDVSLQAALSPLVGLIMATAGCPPLSFFRSQARFHLPFASPTETLARATSFYLLSQYFVARSGATPDWDLEGLVRAYRAVSVVNRAFANRLRAAAPADANVNALIRLDSVGQEVPGLVEDELEDLRSLFSLPPAGG